MKMNKLQRLRALEALVKDDKTCDWSLMPLRSGEYNQIVDACIEGDMNGLEHLLARHNVPNVQQFRDDMMRLLDHLAENY